MKLSRTLPVVALLSVYFILSIGAIRSKSATFDEIQHITAGYSYWAFNDYRLHPENGILPQRLAALPLLFSKIRFPSTDQPAWHKSNVLEMGYQFLYESGNNADQLLLCGRIIIALLGVALGSLVYFWSRALFGYTGGLLSLTLYVFCPTLLANGALVTSDMTAAFFLIASCALFWKTLQNPQWKNLTLSAFSTGALFLAKFSGPVFIAVAVILLLVRLMKKPSLSTTDLLRIILVHAVVVFGLIWTFYGFRYSSFTEIAAPNDQLFESWNHLQPIYLQSFIQSARQLHLLPESYLYGFASVLKHGQGRRAFLNGQYSLHGWWYFFPYSFIVKTPLPALIILLTACIAFFRLRDRIKIKFYDISPLLVLLLVYWAFATLSTLNIGHRHILPVYPAFYVLAGASTAWLYRQPIRPFFGLLLLWLVLEAAFAYPNFLAYFNEVAGGPKNGYKHLVDSSLDWGQDLPALRHWINEHPNSSPIFLSYFGVANPEYYGITADRLPSYIDLRHQKSGSPSAGTYCISATMLQTVYTVAAGHWSVPYETAYQQLLKHPDNPKRFLLPHLQLARLCAYLRKRNPDDSAGHSILIFRLSDRDIQDALYGPPAELVREIDMR